MKFRSTIFLVFLTFISTFQVAGQQGISGTILSTKDSTAIYGASVYFDGTSIGTTTNDEGKFTIKKNATITTPLIISSIGYQQVQISNYNKVTNLPVIYLEEALEQLDPVIVEDDTWNRNVKMKIFLREFLGSSQAAGKCKIKNPDELILIYHPSSHQLTGYSETTLIIENKFLGYRIQYDLMDFEVNFQENDFSPYYINNIYFEGRSFFVELENKVKKKYLKNREKSYLGSLLHFMRSLKNTQLAENNFKIFQDKFQVLPYSVFQLKPEEGLVWVKLLKDQISILYNDFEQTGLQTKGEFSIDEFGNHYPPRNVILSGDMAKNRAANLLPLDYKTAQETL